MGVHLGLDRPLQRVHRLVRRPEFKLDDFDIHHFVGRVRVVPDAVPLLVSVVRQVGGRSSPGICCGGMRMLSFHGGIDI